MNYQDINHRTSGSDQDKLICRRSKHILNGHDSENVLNLIVVMKVALCIY